MRVDGGRCVCYGVVERQGKDAALYACQPSALQSPAAQTVSCCCDLLLWPCRRVAKATGATVVTTLADMDGNETFEASAVGHAEEVSNETTP